jgi:hypothetical protein
MIVHINTDRGLIAVVKADSVKAALQNYCAGTLKDAGFSQPRYTKDGTGVTVKNKHGVVRTYTGVKVK